MGLLFDVILPVSLHVLDAGDGGGGISSLSAVSLLLPPFDLLPDDAGNITLFVLLATAVAVAAFNRSFKSFDVNVLVPVPLVPALALLAPPAEAFTLLPGNGCIVINLNRQLFDMSQAAFNNWPTRGIPFEMVKPIAPG